MRDVYSSNASVASPSSSHTGPANCPKLNRIGCFLVGIATINGAPGRFINASSINARVGSITRFKKVRRVMGLCDENGTWGNSIDIRRYQESAAHEEQYRRSFLYLSPQLFAGKIRHPLRNPLPPCQDPPTPILPYRQRHPPSSAANAGDPC